jgi:hypothetical protein
VTDSIYNNLLVSLAIAAMVVQINTVPLYYLLFSFNQTEIALARCEKKQPGCNGHCFLKRQIAQSSGADDRSTSPNSHQNESFESLLNLSFLSSSSDTPMAPEIVANHALVHSTGPLASGWRTSPFQPPRQA